jgi:hypothetical protein
MATHDDKWFEIWYSQGDVVTPTYLLIVTPNPTNTDKILILDPFMNNQIVFDPIDYEAACQWLRENEYHPVKGREVRDDRSAYKINRSNVPNSAST